MHPAPQGVQAINHTAPSHSTGVKLGLALGGGAALGYAHIGVLDVLERNGIRPHLVAGSSIGAVIGGLWAANKLDALSAWALQLSRSDMLGLMDFTLNGGLIAGRRLKARMRHEVGDLYLESLPVPFTAVATECHTGREVWLTHGDFVSALRASYALPGLFTPVHLGQRWLMDGALVNPVPVAPLRAGGADVIIAVDLNGAAFPSAQPLHYHGGERDDLPRTDKNGPGIQTPMDLLNPARLRAQFFPGDDKSSGLSLPTVIMDALNITQDRITRSRLAEDPPEVLITPALQDTGLFDFHRGHEIMEIGRAAAEAALPSIHAALQCCVAGKLHAT